MILKAIAFLVIGLILGSMVISKIMIKLDSTRFCGKYPEAIFIFAIMVAFLYSLVAELAGLSAIIGSFLAGVALTRVKLKHDVSFRKGAEHLQIIFASIFFISLGVLLDLRVITLDLVWFIFILTIVALFTKLIGCAVPAKLQGINTRDSLIIGVGMVPRGEVAMIVALIGLNQNLITPNMYAALVLMSLLTTIIPPLILRNWLFKVKSKKKKANGIKTETLHQT